MPILYFSPALRKGGHPIKVEFKPEGKSVLIEVLVTNKTTGITYRAYPDLEVPQARAGDTLRIKTTWRNEGTNATMYATIKDDTGATLADWEGFVLSWYIYTCTADPVTMPNREYKITVSGGHVV